MPNRKQLGDLEHRVMEFLWANGPSTAEAVRKSLSADRPLTDSTIRTVLRRLEAKNFVRHRTEGRQFLYSGVRQPRSVAADAVKDIIRKLCSGSLEELLIGLVDQRVVGSAQLRRLAEKVDQRERERRKI